MVGTRHGAPGVCVTSHVTKELRVVIVYAPIPRLHTEVEIAALWDQLLKHKNVTGTSAQVSLLTQRISHYISYKCT